MQEGITVERNILTQWVVVQKCSEQAHDLTTRKLKKNLDASQIY